MNIVMAGKARIPAIRYGGIERVMWWLGKELARLGHQVTYIVDKGSSCYFGSVIVRDEGQEIASQIPEDADVVHFHYPIDTYSEKPYVVTIHDNDKASVPLSLNSIFISQDHAARYGAQSFVYNGIDEADYGKPDFKRKRNGFHFLGKAAWRVKNVRGAIDVATLAGEQLVVLGGSRLNFKMGFRFTPHLNVHFKGMVGGEKKNTLINGSKGLIFPVRWHEPFGIAIIESLYFGCPVFGTPYGALPEIVIPGMGVLSSNRSDLVEAVKEVDGYDRVLCHEYVCDSFSSNKMARAYLRKYEEVIAGRDLNKEIPKLRITQEPRFLTWNT